MAHDAAGGGGPAMTSGGQNDLAPSAWPRGPWRSETPCTDGGQDSRPSGGLAGLGVNMAEGDELSRQYDFNSAMLLS